MGRGRLLWGFALAMAAGCGQEFVKDEGLGGNSGSASGGSDAGGSMTVEPSAGTTAGGTTGGGGRGPIFPGVGGSLVAQAGDNSGESGAAGAPPVDVPPPIPLEGLELWFDASRGVGQVNGVVSSWADQSGHHRDALQTAINLRPKLVDGALAGKPALVFDGDEAAGDYLKLPTLDVDFAQGVSLFVAGLQTAGAAETPCEGFFEASNGPEVDDIHIGTWRSAIIFEVSELYINDVNFPLLLDEPQILAGLLDKSGSGQVRRNSNGVGEKGLGLPVLTPRTQVFLGRSLYAECKPLHGVIGEVLLYSRSITDPELIQIESYLQKRWGCCTE